MTRSHSIPYNPSLRLIGLSFGLAVFFFAVGISAIARPHFVLWAAVAFLVLSVLLLLRRALRPQSISIDDRAITVPCGFFHLRSVCAPFEQIEKVTVVQIGMSAVLCVWTPSKRIEINSLFVPDHRIFTYLYEFLLAVAKSHGMVTLEWSEIAQSPPPVFEGTNSGTWIAAAWGPLRRLSLAVGGEGGLFFGMIGHVVLYSGLTRGRSEWAIVILPLVAMPVLLVAILDRLKPSLFRRPIVSRRILCACLLVAMGWYATETLLAEVLLLCDVLPPDGPRFARNLARIMIHAGWISFIPLAMQYLSGRQAIRASTEATV